MKNLLLSSFFLSFLVISPSLLRAQTPPTSAQVVENILTIQSYQGILIQTKEAINALLDDPKVTNEQDRNLLTLSKNSINEMLDQKTGNTSPQLIELSDWIKKKHIEINAIKDGGGQLSAEQNTYMDSQLFKGGFDTSLTTILRGVLGSYVRIDKDACQAPIIEGYIQLYFKMNSVLEEDSWNIPDYLLLHTPQWIQSRYPQLAEDQKRQFLKDVNDARAEKALGPAADTEPGPPPTPQEQAAYEAAYQFIVNNTPPP